MQFLALSKGFIPDFILQAGELYRKHLLPSYCSSGISRAGIYPFELLAVIKEKLLVPSSPSTFSTSQLNSSDDINLTSRRTCHRIRSSSCDTFSTKGELSNSNTILMNTIVQL